MNYLDLLKFASPEAVVVVTALVVLSIGLLTTRAATICSVVAGVGLVTAIFAVSMLPRNAVLFGGMLVLSPLTSLFKIICIVLAFFTVLLASGERLRNQGEYLALILLATVGLMLLVGSEELLMIFIGLELLGLSLYVLTAFNKTDPQPGLGRSGPEIFPVWQHGERIHTFWNQCDLWNVRIDISGRYRPEIGNGFRATIPRRRNRHDVDRLRL